MQKNLDRVDKDAQEELANGCKQLKARLSELDARELSVLILRVCMYMYSDTMLSLSLSLSLDLFNWCGSWSKIESFFGQNVHP